MSPEQVHGDLVDHRSDIFSAGAVFYQLLTGKKPFTASNLPAVLERVAKGAPAPLPAEVPPEVARTVMRALEKNPERRYQRMQQMASEFARFLQMRQHTRPDDDSDEASTVVQQMGVNPPGLHGIGDRGEGVADRAIETEVSQRQEAGPSPSAAQPRPLVSAASVPPVDETRVREQERTARAQERAAREPLRLARSALQNGEYGRAIWAAENALALCPSSLEASQIVAEARQLSGSGPVPSAAPGDVDDTVALQRFGRVGLFVAGVRQSLSNLRDRLPWKTRRPS